MESKKGEREKETTADTLRAQKSRDSDLALRENLTGQDWQC